MVSRLYGYRLALMRGAWVVVAFLALVVFMAGLPASFREALRISDATRLGLAQVGLSARFPAYFYLTGDILTFVSFGGIALVLAWRRSDDWAVLFIAMMLLLTGLLYTQRRRMDPFPSGSSRVYLRWPRSGRSAFSSFFLTAASSRGGPPGCCCPC